MMTGDVDREMHLPLYNKPLLIRITGEKRASGLMKQTIPLKDKKNGKFNNIVSADENKHKNITPAISSFVRS
jgi:hypothetical protein